MDSKLLEMIITVVCAVIASSGFWTFIQSRRSKKDTRVQMLLGISHYILEHLIVGYISRGWITPEEHEDLQKYFYEPYIKMGGNGHIKHLMDEVNKLPIHTLQGGQEGNEHEQQGL